MEVGDIRVAVRAAAPAVADRSAAERTNTSVAMTRRLRRARCDTETTLERLDFGADAKLPATQIRDLAGLR